MQRETQRLKGIREDRAPARNSGIELLKIFGIFLIVISHVMQTLGSENLLVPYRDYVLDLSTATTDIQRLALTILRYSGAIGNNIFFVCSAWFLLDSKKVKKEKWMSMLVEVWVISIVILVITCIARGGNVDKMLVLKSLMPTTFAANWYVTCYLLFYPIHTSLNKVIKSMSQTQLLRACVALAVVYMGFDFLKGDLFFPSPVILWVAIYFVVGYVKIYLPEFCSKRATNVLLLCFGLAGHLGIILLTNFLGLRIGFFSDKLVKWNANCNPFIIVSVIAMLNLAHSMNFENRFINNVSKLSLLIYILHDNIVLRTYYRTYAVNYIYENFGYSHVLLWILLLAVVIFAAAAMVSALYALVLRKSINRLRRALYGVCVRMWRKFEVLALKLR